MSGPPRRVPPRTVVERIVREEAARSNVDVARVLGASNVLAAKIARTRAISRIMCETGCSHLGLEEVWGASLKKLAARKVQGGYDKATVDRLIWRYGDERAAKIVAGKDPSTERDIAGWRRICAKANPA